MLGDANSRSDYDAKGYVLDEQNQEPTHVAVQPIACCACGKISIQPRYVIYRQVVSFLFATYHSGCQGVFCAKCGATRAYRTSGITWLLGWWGIPWGPIYSTHAIIRNMLGEQPAINNFRVLAMQAAHFASQNRMDIARLLADQALEFVPKIPAFASGQEAQVDRDLRALLAAIRDSTAAPARALKTSWGIKSLPFKIQALAASVVSIVLAGFLISGASHARNGLSPRAPKRCLRSVRFKWSSGDRSASIHSEFERKPNHRFSRTHKLCCSVRSTGKRALQTTGSPTPSDRPHAYLAETVPRYHGASENCYL